MAEFPKLNREGYDHAVSLIQKGEVTESESWEFEWARDGDRLINKGGLNRWCLARYVENPDPKVKDHWGFPFSSDGRTVNRRGLIAAYQRASQQGYTNIVGAAKRLLSLFEEQKEDKRFIPFCKIEPQKHLVYGIVYEPETLDGEGDYAEEAVIEEAAHTFLSDYKSLRLMHSQPLPRHQAVVVESYIAPLDFSFPASTLQKSENLAVRKGSWILVVKVLNEELWEKIQAGELTGFSMGGYLFRE